MFIKLLWKCKINRDLWLSSHWILSASNPKRATEESGFCDENVYSKESTSSTELISENILIDDANQLEIQSSVEPIVYDKTSDNVRRESVSLSNDLSFEQELKQCMEIFPVVGKNNAKDRFVRCKVCMAFPNIVKLNSDNNKPPPMTTMAGSRYRQRYVSEHFQSKYHKACKIANEPTTSNVKNSIKIYVDSKRRQPTPHTSKEYSKPQKMKKMRP